jgi:hypothetical protein
VLLEDLKMKATLIWVSLQCLMLLAFFFGDFGFDHPGKYGLSFNHFILLAMAYCSCVIAGLIHAAAFKRWWAMVLQATIPAAAIVGSMVIPKILPPLDASQYQYLVGLDELNVRKALPSRFTRHSIEAKGVREVHRYDGIKVTYLDGRVESVTSDEPVVSRGVDETN